MSDLVQGAFCDGAQQDKTSFYGCGLGGNGHCYMGIPIFGPAFSPFLLPISYIGPAINLWCPRKLEVVHSLVLLEPLCEQF